MHPSVKIGGMKYTMSEQALWKLALIKAAVEGKCSVNIPRELYADKSGIFFVNNKKKEHWTVDEMLAGKPLDKTQFGTIAKECFGITMITAHSARR